MIMYISILRGINVSGQKCIKMDALRKMYENLGFKDIRTYAQSGNVIFQSREYRIDELEQIIRAQIKKDFGFDVPVILLPSDRLEKIVENNPFARDLNKDIAFMHVTFLSAKPKEFKRETIEAKKTVKEEIIFSDEAIYLYCPGGYGKTKLSNNFLETVLKVEATTRNWKSTTELLKVSKEIS
jgi:uncharacterized protein (DUF1697 family)